MANGAAMTIASDIDCCMYSNYHGAMTIASDIDCCMYSNYPHKTLPFYLVVISVCFTRETPPMILHRSQLKHAHISRRQDANVICLIALSYTKWLHGASVVHVRMVMYVAINLTPHLSALILHALLLMLARMDC